MKKSLTVLHSDEELELYFTLYPFILNHDKYNIHFRYFDVSKINQYHGNVVIFTRIFKNKFSDLNFIYKTIDKLRRSFNYIYFLDDNAGADSTHFEFIDKLDGYFKAKLPVDFSIFENKIYGRQIFSDYYHQQFNVIDKDKENYREPASNLNQINKLKLAFNLGYGLYPSPKSGSIKRKIGYGLCYNGKIHLLKSYYRLRHLKLINELSKQANYKNKSLYISARFRYQSYPKSIGYQRFLLEEKIQQNKRFLTGLVPSEKYMRELKTVFATLSPFGYGEVCLRDFEAIINGSLLIKPDMSHMKTTPNIYIPNETYIPIKWDGSDLLDKADDILSNPEDYQKIIDNSRTVYRKSLLDMDEKFAGVFGPLF